MSSRACWLIEEADARRILVRLVSSALTGFFYTTSRPRLADKLAMMKYDPVGESQRRAVSVSLVRGQFGPRGSIRDIRGACGAALPRQSAAPLSPLLSRHSANPSQEACPLHRTKDQVDVRPVCIYPHSRLTPTRARGRGRRRWIPGPQRAARDRAARLRAARRGGGR